MKFGFSTIGCPDWLWKEILSVAKDLGYDGIEIRGLGADIYLPASKVFAPPNIPAILDDLNKLNMEIPCLTTGAHLFDINEKDSAFKEITAYIDQAASLKTPYIRILGDSEPHLNEPKPDSKSEALLEEQINKLLPHAAVKNVTLLLETNGIYADSTKLKSFIEKINHPNLAVLWDIHHPIRVFNETVEDTYKTLKPWIRHVHVKDSVVTDGKVVYQMTGYGDIPIKETLKLLGSDGYNGYVVLEWVRRWNMELEGPGVVFSHFINAVKQMMEREV